MTTKTLSKSETATKLKTDLPRFTGTDYWYKHELSKLTYTDGVKYLAEIAQCYWLIDIVGSLYFHPDKLMEKEDFLGIKLVVNESDNSAVFTADDGNGNILYTQNIPFTDFPLTNIKLFCANDVLLLPSEY